MRSRLSIAFLSLALSLVAGTTQLSAAPEPDEVSFRYRIGKVEYDPRLNPNSENLTKLESILSGPNASSIQRIEMRASSSPEGPYFLNVQYAHERAEWMKNFITERYPSLPSSVWQVEEVAEDWDGVAEYLRHSTEDYKSEAMEIVRSKSSNRKELLQDLYAGEAWDDLNKYAFPWLRAVKLRIVYSDTPVWEQQEQQVQPQDQQEQPQDQQEQPQDQQGQQGQQGQRVVEPIFSDGTFPIIFKRSSSVLDQALADNSRQIDLIKQEVERGADSLVLVSYASPEGTQAVNMSISKKRSAAVRDYLSKQTGIPAEMITIRDTGEDWEGFTKAVNNNYEGADRDEVLRILRDDTLSPDAKENALKKLDNGRTWQSLIQNQANDLRRIEVYCLKAAKEEEPVKPDIPEITDTDVDIPQEDIEVEDITVDIEETDINVETIELPEEEEVVVVEETGPKPILAISTNLLYDAGTAFNLGVEVPIGRHLSINADAIYNNMAFSEGRLLDVKLADLQLYYYFNDKGPALKGWFVSAGGGGGVYNIATKTKGWEGDVFYLMGGTGYSFQLGPESSHWRLRLEAGMGPLWTDFKYYERNDKGELYHKRNDHLDWGLPTNVEVSLIYLFQTAK